MFQRLFTTLLTAIIGLQLMASAIPHHAFSSVALAETCGSGLQWNEMLGRCLTTQQAAQVKDASQTCEKAADDAAKKQCYRGVIEGQMSDAGVAGAGKIKTDLIPTAMAMATLVASVMFLMSGSTCSSTGAYLMAGGAVAVIAGEIMASNTYKSKLKKAQEKFKAISDSSSSKNSDNGNATSAQAEAFQAMIELEEATISAAKTKNNLYMVATAAYAGAAVISALEIYWASTGTDGGSLNCNSTNSSGFIQDPSSREDKKWIFPKNLAEVYVDNYFIRKQRVSFETYVSTEAIHLSQNATQLAFANQELILIKRGYSQGAPFETYEKARNHIESHFSISNEEFSLMKLGAKVAQQFSIGNAKADVMAMFSGLLGELQPVVWPYRDPLKNLYMTPFSRLALSGIMTVNNMFMIGKTNKEKKKAEERKAFIEKLKAQVEAAGAEFGCANNDRNNMAKPNCYCYSEGGMLNPARVNSNTCKALFGAKPALATTKTTNSEGISTEKNCVAANGSLDASCSCRTNNSCVTVKSPTVVGNIPAGTILGNLPPTINGLNNGSLSAADINNAEFGNLAAKLTNMKDKLLADPKNKNLALQAKKAKAQGDKFMQDMERSLASSPALAAASNASANEFSDATSPSAALEVMKKDLQQQIKGYESNSSVSSQSSSTSSKKTDDFSFDALNGAGPNGGVTVADEKLAEAMNSEYEMGNSDINTNSSANIFDILTNRYQRSGMRRLFGGEALVPADKANANEISQ